MNRRNFIQAGVGLGIAGGAVFAAPSEAGHFYEIRNYQLRNDAEPRRLSDFFQEHFMPMAARQGIGPVGCFTVVVGQYSPALIVVIDYKSLGDMQASLEKAQADGEYMKAWESFEKTATAPYVRYETALLKAFAGHPKMEVPAALAGNASRLFELRTYESRSGVTLRAKIDMFNQEEIKIFKDCGFANVFFGEAIAGTRLPHLTYMVGFDSMDAREKAWNTFRNHPDWTRIRNKPGWTDPEAVSNSHASFLRPTGFSQIK